MKRNIDKIVLNYLEAVLFTEENDENGLKELTVYNFDSKPTDNAEMNTMDATRLLVESFLGLALPLLTEEWTDEQIGHDLWLTRCGHGAGFWDRDLHGEVYAENGVAYINDSEVSCTLLFENYEMLPKNVQEIIFKFSDDENTYESCGNLVDELREVGYYCEYYLDAEPYHLRYIGKDEKGK
jgi:hypothetical protein